MINLRSLWQEARMILSLVASLAIAIFFIIVSFPFILASLVAVAGLGLYFYWRIRRLIDKAERSFEQILQEEEGEIIDVECSQEPPEHLSLPR